MMTNKLMNIINVLLLYERAPDANTLLPSRLKELPNDTSSYGCFELCMSVCPYPWMSDVRCRCLLMSSLQVVLTKTTRWTNPRPDTSTAPRFYY